MTAGFRRLEADRTSIRRYVFGETTKQSVEMTMDDRDRALIAMLRENARAPTALLARRLGLSRTTVQARLERLERSGVIAGYGVRLSDDAERGLIRAHVLITILPKTAARIEAELRGNRRGADAAFGERQLRSDRHRRGCVDRRARPPDRPHRRARRRRAHGVVDHPVDTYRSLNGRAACRGSGQVEHAGLA